MPVNWTPQADQKLLLKTLEVTPDRTIDVAKIAERWADEKDTTSPTPRAIGDRLKKLTKEAGFKTPIKLSGSRSTAKYVLVPSTPVNDSSDEDMPDVKSSNPLNFLHSRFGTAFAKKPKSTTGKNKRKRVDPSSSDEAISSSEESDADIALHSGEGPSTRSSKRRRVTGMVYNLSDDGKDDSAGSEGGYDPDVEDAKERTMGKKRGRKAARMSGEKDEKA